jgi:hypothetical protein
VVGIGIGPLPRLARARHPFPRRRGQGNKKPYPTVGAFVEITRFIPLPPSPGEGVASHSEPGKGAYPKTGALPPK